jgi:signal peptidase
MILFLAFMALISTNRENTFSLGKYSVYNVLTDSMLPTFGSGSILIVKDVRQNEIKNGDIITFYPVEDNSTVLTHRIIGLAEEDGEIKYQTQGDNNNVPERHPVDYGKIIGKVVFYADGWGNYLLMIRTPIGITVIIGATVLFLALSYIADASKKKKKAAAARARKRKGKRTASKPGSKRGTNKKKNTPADAPKKKAASDKGIGKKTTAKYKKGA